MRHQDPLRTRSAQHAVALRLEKTSPSATSVAPLYVAVHKALRPATQTCSSSTDVRKGPVPDKFTHVTGGQQFFISSFEKSLFSPLPFSCSRLLCSFHLYTTTILLYIFLASPDEKGGPARADPPSLVPIEYFPGSTSLVGRRNYDVKTICAGKESILPSPCAPAGI